MRWVMFDWIYTYSRHASSLDLRLHVVFLMYYLCNYRTGKSMASTQCARARTCDETLIFGGTPYVRARGSINKL